MLGYTERCREIVQAAGEANPKFPILDGAVVDGLLASLLRGGRWLLTFDHESKLQIVAMPLDVMLVSPSNSASVAALVGNTSRATSCLTCSAPVLSDCLAPSLDAESNPKTPQFRGDIWGDIGARKNTKCSYRKDLFV